MSKWRASSLGNPGIKDLGHVLRGILKLSAKREGGGERKRVRKGSRKIYQRERTIMAPNRVPLLREAVRLLWTSLLVSGNDFDHDVKDNFSNSSKRSNIILWTIQFQYLTII